MTILSLPGGIYPCAAQWALEQNVGGNQNPLGNTIQRIQRDGGRWRADLTFPTLNQEQGGLLAAYLDKASRGDMWTYITPPHNDARGNWGPDELVVNGDLTRDVSGWSAGSGAALNVNARRLRVRVGGSPGAIAVANQTGLATEVDQPHVVMVDLVRGSTANWRVKLYPSGSPSQDEHVSYYEDEGRVIFTHIPETSSTTIELACNSTTEQDYCYFANVSVARCLLVNDSLAVGNACAVKGGPTSTNAALKAGEFVTIQLWNGWQMVRLTEDLDTDSSGNGTLRFEPSLRDGVKGGGAVVVHKPFCRMIVPAHASPHAVDMPRLFGFSVSYLEDVTEIGIAENPQDTDLIWYWDAHSYSLAPIIGTGTPTITNGGKTYFDQSGILKTTELDPDATGSPTSYLPAFDHDADTGALRGMLIEEARTNLLLRSEEFDNASWTKTTASATANAATAPNGQDTAEKIVPANAATFGRAEQAVTVSAGTMYTVSVYAKAAEWGWLRIRSAQDNAHSVWFDLRNGVLGASETDWRGHRITDAGNGWYRCDASYQPTGTTFTPRFNPTNENGPIQSTVGDGSAGIYLWGAQLEAGSFPTSYIPTTSATAARAADVPTIPVNQIPNFSTSALTMFAEAIGSPSTPQVLFQLDDGTVNNRATIQKNAGAALSIANNGGATQASITDAAWAAGALGRMAFSLGVNSFAASFNGGATGVDNSGTPPTVTTMRVGSYVSAGVDWNAPIRTLRLYKSRKPNRQIRSLSA